MNNFLIKTGGMLGINHLILILIFLIIYIVTAIVSMKYFTKKGTIIFLKTMAIVMLFFDPIYWIWEIFTYGRINPATTLPLYYCSLFFMLLPFASFTKKNSFLHRMSCNYICGFNIIAGIFGIVFNVYLNRFSMFDFVPVRSLLYHFFMLLIPIIMVSTRYYIPARKDGIYGFIPIAILLSVAGTFDLIFKWDYCYLYGGKGTPIAKISKFLGLPLFNTLQVIVIFLVNYLFSFLINLYHHFVYKKVVKVEA